MRLDRRGVAVVGSLAAVAAATGLVYALKPIAPVLSLGVLYTLAVLAAAVLFGAVYAVVVAVASMVAFNYLFLPPVHTLTLADARNWTALAVYLTTAVVASQLATRARRRAVEAEQREHEAELLADAAAAVLREQPLDELLARASSVLSGGGEHARARFDAGLASLVALAGERRDAEVVRRSDAVKTVILQTVSHDFRTPIATIRAAADGLSDPALALTDADRADLLDSIETEVARLSRLVENVLDLSRIEAGAAAPRTALWEPAALVDHALGEVRAAERVTTRTGEAVPLVSVDAVQLQRVLVNLVENALKFSDGAVEVAVSAHGRQVAVDVLDRGPGLDDAPSSHRGLGLGLAIARGFAAANGGTLELSTRPGGGTRARLLLAGHRVPASVAS